MLFSRSLDHINARVNDMPTVRSATGFKPAHPSRFCLNLLQFMKADPIFKAVPLLLGLISISPQASAEIRAVTAEGEYRMSDRDTKEDAIRLAMEEAKRNALEQVASYLEAVTVVRNFDVTQDEIRSYTAGVAVVLDQKTHTRLENETIVIHVTLTAQVDTDEVVQALAAVKQHEEARHELSSLKQELDQLHQDLNAANQALAAATTSEQVQQYRAQRQKLLSQAQSNALVAQAWTNWIVLVSPLAYPSSWGGLPQIHALVSAAGQLNPNNPHLQVMQQAIAKQTIAPRQPPTLPMPHTVPVLPRMPTYQVVPQQPLASQAPAAQSSGSWNKPPASRRLESVYQLNPLLPRPPDPRSPGRPPIVIQQVSPRPARPPSLHTVPHMPQQSVPSTQGQPSSGAAPPPQGATLQPGPQPRSPRSLAPQVQQLLQSPQRQHSNASGASSEGMK